MEWIPAITNHLYWSIQSSDGNPEALVERYTSVIHHITNRHEFLGKYYTKCEHGPYEQEEGSRSWLKMDNPAHAALKSVILNKILLQDLKKLNENVFTTYLEVFHALKIRYLPKSIFFEQPKMVAGLQLAALDHNININREQVSLTFIC